MPKRPHIYHRPENLTQALQLLAQPDTVPLAGGTHLLAKQTDSAVVDLQNLGLDEVEWSADQVQIGAMVTLTNLAGQLASQAKTESPAALLQRAIRLAGPNTFRNAATLGGVIASHPPDSELLASLLLLDTQLVIHTPERKLLALEAYLQAAEKPAGLITQIQLSWHAGKGYSERVARTPADQPIISITFWQPAGYAPRLAATGIDSRPVRLARSEAALADKIDDSTIDEAGQAAKQANHHPGDFRGDAAYRAEMAAVLTRRVCRLAAPGS